MMEKVESWSAGCGGCCSCSSGRTVQRCVTTLWRRREYGNGNVPTNCKYYTPLSTHLPCDVTAAYRSKHYSMIAKKRITLFLLFKTWISNRLISQYFYFFSSILLYLYFVFIFIVIDFHQHLVWPTFGLSTLVHQNHRNSPMTLS